ncbi:MAG TPA: DeoR/GlpR transcriptional regulator [Thermotoga sp.]|nr:DeoR/GlpR transcriptional regulator [Thermotoga sp.]
MREKRLEKILNLLKEKGFVTVKELKESLEVSEATIRRDLNILKQHGLIEKYRGGASLRGYPKELSFFTRLDELKNEKRRIAKKTVQLLESHQVIALGGGSTIYYMVLAFDDSSIQDLTIITNSITTAWAVIQLKKSFKLIHTGGTVRENSFECIGGHVLSFLERINFDMFITGADGIHPVMGITFTDIEEALVARKMLEQSKKIIVVADHRKIGKIAPIKMCDTKEIDYLITDDLPRDMIPSLEKQGVSIILA